MFIKQIPLVSCCKILCEPSSLFANRTKIHSIKLLAGRYLPSAVLNDKNCRGMSNSNSTEIGSVSGDSVAHKSSSELEPIIRLNNIRKSQQDTRDYRGLQLQNGIKVLLVSDTKTDVSAAALAVQVGHMSDPDNLPGLAHFCEHMLFLGTEKYPHENGYTTYLSQSGGSSNAATYPLMTKYHFYVAPDKLDEALDRFSQFFIGPLFTPCATEREINAVNSEHEKNLSSDVWRIKQVQRHLAKVGHAYKKFGSGNKMTLYETPKQQNIEVRDELLKFYKQWYSSNIMSLAVIGKETLDELENMVMEKFSEIENKNVEIPHWPREPYDIDQYGQKLLIVPVKDLRSLTISFTTDDLTQYYKSAPDSYLSHLLGHEGKGSILSELRRLGWCNDFLAGHQNTLNGFGFFEISIDLTQEGVDHVDDIIEIVFQYLRMVRERGPQKWIFDECVKINEMRFRFKEKEKPERLVTGVVSCMQVYPLEQVLTAPYLNNEWRPDLITKLLDELIPSKCRVILVGQNYEKEANLTEPYYQTKYGMCKIDKDIIKKWESCDLNENLDLPLPNAFIPENFELAPFDDDLSKHPLIIMDTEILRVWHKQDNFYLKPKACMSFDMSNPIAYLDPLHCNLNYLMVALIKDQLNEYLYDADLADLKLQVGPRSNGIDLKISGYNDKQVVLLKKLLDHLFDFNVDEKRFHILKDEYKRSLKNFSAEQPYQHSIYYLALLLTENAWANSELLDAMELVTFDRVLSYAKEFFSRLHTECFIYGNVTKQQAVEIAGLVNKRLEGTNAMVLPLLARQMLGKREYKLCAGDSYLFEKNNNYHKSSCAQLYFQCGPQTDRSNIMVNLIAQILTEPCYDCLRTKEQLGYIVFSGMRKVNGANGIRIIVQSSKRPSYVEGRIETFLDNYLKLIEEMPQDEFNRHKEALMVKKLEKPKTVNSQFSLFYSEIALSQYHFERSEAEVEILRNITKAEVLECYKKTQVLRSDVALNKNVLLKKQTAAHTLRSSTDLNESIASSNENERSKIKLSNAATPTSNNQSKKGAVHKLQQQGKITGNSETNKSIHGKISSTSQQKNVPLSSKPAPTTSKVIQRATAQKHKSPTIIGKTPVYKKQNAVLDTPQNVTVCSPPPQKKKNDHRKVVHNDDKKSDNLKKLVRKGSRTLAPDEIVILKREPAKIRSESLQTDSYRNLTIALKDPVAFEVKFEGKNIKERSIFREKVNGIDGTDRNDEEINYSDDFESYESDFETGSSTGSLEKSDSSPSLQSNDFAEISVQKSENCELPETNQYISFSQLAFDGGEHENDLQVTQSSTKDMPRDKETKLDSGHYDVNSRKINHTKSSEMSAQFIQPLTDSLETSSLGTSEQMDSGISTCATSIPVSYNKSFVEIIYGGYKDFYTKPIVNARGSELMTKIQFDILSFTLVDLKPISYDIFMQTFGKLNTNQQFTQTEDNQINVEQQTEVQETRSIWTQHPAQFQLEIAKNLDKNAIYNSYCSGEIFEEYESQILSQCELEQSLDAIKQLNKQRSKRYYQNYQKRQRRPINYEHLNSFLLRSSAVIDQILGSFSANTKDKLMQNSDQEVLKRVSGKSFYIEANFLNTLRVLKLFSNSKYNLLITVHESLPDTNVYSSDFTNLLMVWCTNNCDKPLRLLTTWSQVSKVEISNDSSDIIVAALRDGSIALWDLRETYSFCSKLDGYLTHFAATQSIIPSWCGEKNNSKLIMDLGACLDVKSFRSQTNSMILQTKFPKTQFVSLHDSGCVTVWTLVETSEMSIIDLSQTEKYEKLKCPSKFTHTFEYTSPWARVKLTQSTSVNIKEYVETKSHHSQSRFDKTKAFFQKNVYSDEALRELHEYTSEVVGQQGIRFASLECGSENIFICTNRNFILMCSKSLKMDKLKRIIVHESQFLFPTALKVLSNENFLAIGLSNGVVMISNCQAHKVQQNQKITKKSRLSESVCDHGDSILDNNTVTGKSCTIQNILLNVQKSCEDMDFDREYRPSTAACISLIESKKKPFELRIMDQQVIMSGSVLRKNLIQSLELSSDGWYLFALANGHVRIYDFYSDQEISHDESQETGQIIGITTGKCGCQENNLMILRTSSEVEVHILNK